MSDPPQTPRASRFPPVRGPYGVALALSATAALLMVLVAAGWQPLLDLDGRIARALHSSALERPTWTRTARVLTDWVWDPWTMRALTAAAVLWLWSRAERTLAVRIAVAAVSGALAQQVLKAVLGRERPEWERPVDTAHFAAMPSGHAMTTAMTCGLLLWAAWQLGSRGPLWWGAAALAVVSSAGVSVTRIYLGVHWLTDVVAGCLLGGAVAAWAAAHASWRREPRPERITA
ncbi:phosphatase PAP2 family protein [Streptomyces sp. Z26]|uniref:phosphatase PAP2 family protein n=1 Tax=Streptomyces sp. Z26 TaxID=2500177 RepID=UPI000EF1463D|nr:phosphatase PAP2 family protein [Streptomyces sp. Z26]RLL69931.1 phosphatase PAP2 family protein [Streptomyces sp. Z26]